MYAPHASLARIRPATLDSLALAPTDDLSVGSAVLAVPVVGAVGALAALSVAYHLLRTYPLPLRPALELVVGRARRLSLADPRIGPSWSPAWFGIATALTGLTALVPLAGTWLGADPIALSTVVTMAAIVAGAAFLAALVLMMPSTGLRARLRSVLDGAIVCLCLLFCAWALAIRHAGVDAALLAIIVFHCWVLATAMLAGFASEADEGRRGSLFCAAGVWLATLALSALTYGLTHGLATAWLVLTGVVFVVAPVLVWRGSVAVASGRPTARAVAIPRPLATAVAGAVALFATLHQLFEGERIDWGAMTIGGAAVLGVGIRHILWPAPVEPAGPPPAGPPSFEPLAGRAPTPRPQFFSWVDPQTGLATRHHLSFAIAGLRCESRTGGSLIAVAVEGLDAVDGACADLLLREVSRRLAAVGPDGPCSELETIARLSQSHFALLTRAPVLRAYGLASRLVSALGEPVEIAGRRIRLSACVGLTQLAGADSTEETIRRAELALRRARQLGEHRVEWYDAEVEKAVERQETIERDLPEALRRGELDLIYQPIMDLVRDRPVAVEALLRWRHPQLGTLLPADVIPAAEETGVIGEVSHWVLGRAAAQLCSWRDAGRDLSMAVNVSPRRLDTTELTAALGRILACRDLPPDRLVFEVAESAIEDGGQLAEDLGALRALGVRTAIDEFGAGHESLSHLRQLPIDMVKIGKSFFEADDRASAALPLVDVIVGVGRRLGVDVVAQCLEAPVHLAVVRTAGCRIGQGHLFARPQPAEHTEAYLAGFPSRP